MSRPARIILIIGICLVLLTGAVLFFGTRGMDEMQKAPIPQFSLATIADGTYQGESTISRWAVRVEVSVKDHLIKSIRVIDSKMSNLGPDMTQRMNTGLIGTTSPSFDAVSGASLTSKGYLLAVGDALFKASRPQ